MGVRIAAVCSAVMSWRRKEPPQMDLEGSLAGSGLEWGPLGASWALRGRITEEASRGVAHKKKLIKALGAGVRQGSF